MGAGVVVVTDRRQALTAGRSLVDTVAAALDAGAGAVLLREKDLGRPERQRLADVLRSCTAASGARFVVASDVAVALDAGADGVHLAAGDPWPAGGPGAALGVGRSCHGRDELLAAAGEGVTWVTLSPVFVSASKPGYGPPLGVDGLAAGCRATPGLPVVALGGIDPTNAGSCRGAGAAGVAVMGAVMAAEHPAAVVRRLVTAVAEAPGAWEGAGR